MNKKGNICPGLDNLSSVSRIFTRTAGLKENVNWSSNPRLYAQLPRYYEYLIYFTSPLTFTAPPPHNFRFKFALLMVIRVAILEI